MIRFKFWFHFLKSILEVYNRRVLPGQAPCKCNHIHLAVSFIQTFNTDPSASEAPEQVVILTAKPYADQKFGGTKDRTYELVTDKIREITFSVLEQLIANRFDWFASEDDRELVLVLYEQYKEVTSD